MESCNCVRLNDVVPIYLFKNAYSNLNTPLIWWIKFIFLSKMLKWDNGLNIISKTASLKDERTFTQHNLNLSPIMRKWNGHTILFQNSSKSLWSLHLLRRRDKFNLCRYASAWEEHLKAWRMHLFRPSICCLYYVIQSLCFSPSCVRHVLECESWGNECLLQWSTDSTLTGDSQQSEPHNRQ